jgi:hypothetical protein
MSDSVYVKIFAGKEGAEIAQDVDTRIYVKNREGLFLRKYSLTRYRGKMVLSGLGYLTVRWYCPCKFSLWSDMKEITKVCERE